MRQNKSSKHDQVTNMPTM